MPGRIVNALIQCGSMNPLMVLDEEDKLGSDYRGDQPMSRRELLEVEVTLMDGTGKIECTGNLGDVMKESIHIAVSCLRSRAKKLNLDPDFYKNKDIHVHFPEGAVPKDGPSAGVTITTALVSAMTGKTVRRDLAMTGEISLHGRVLPIGGLREKTMAALRNGVKTVIIPKGNVADLEEIDPAVRDQLSFVPAEMVEDVLAEALPTVWKKKSKTKIHHAAENPKKESVSIHQ